MWLCEGYGQGCQMAAAAAEEEEEWRRKEGWCREVAAAVEKVEAPLSLLSGE